MSNTFDTSDWPSIESLRARMKTETQRAIAQSLGASRTTLRRYLNGINPPPSDTHDPAAIAKSDQSFIDRMREAISAGKEKATEGINATAGTKRVRSISRPLAGSGCGSPAALCVGWA